MFSNNDKISSRQIKRLLIFDLFGASSLLLPAQLAKTGNSTGLWSAAAGILLAGMYLWLLHACYSQVPQDYLIYLQDVWGGFLARLVYLCYAAVSVLVCAWAAKLLSELVCESLLENREFAVTLLLIVLLALYGGISGLEARARIYEMLFWVLAVPVAVMLLLCVRQIQAVRWFPLTVMQEGSWSRLWNGSWHCFLAFLPLTFLLFLKPHVQEQKKTGRAAAGALAVSGGALVAIYLVLTGIFDTGALAQERFAVITLMGMVKIPGDFVKRLDAVMVSVWFFTLYALVGTTLYYGVVIARRVLAGQPDTTGGSMQNGKKYRRGRNYWFWCTAAVVYGAAYGFHKYPQIEAAAHRAFYLAGAPFMVLVPLLSVVLYRLQGRMKKKA